MRRAVAQTLTLAGFTVQAFDNAESALRVTDSAFAGVVVSDVRLHGKSGLALLRTMQDIDAEIPVVLITGHGDVAMAVEAMQTGAYDFIEKPFAPKHLVTVVQRASERRQLVIENRLPRQHVLAGGNEVLIGDSASMARVRALIAAIGPMAADVLIEGETGTGKEVVARALHAASGRQGEFVAINCGALPESVFESEVFGHEAGSFTGATKARIGKIEFAQHGTLFLDEIESMALALQIKLLRVLQERRVERLGSNKLIPVDFRVVAATKSNLRELSDRGEFRADLYYRLNVVVIDLPPLRERREDIPALAQHFVNEARIRYGLPAKVIDGEQLNQWLTADWRGNVRELRNAADRFMLGVATGAVSDGSAVSGNVETPSLHDRVDAIESLLIQDALRRAQGNVNSAAQLLSIPRKTLYDKLAKHSLQPERFRP